MAFYGLSMEFNGFSMEFYGVSIEFYGDSMEFPWTSTCFKFSECCTCKCHWTWQTDRQADRQTHRQHTNRQTDIQADRQPHRQHTDRQTDKQIKQPVSSVQFAAHFFPSWENWWYCSDYVSVILLQAILMSLCLQSIVDEILRIKQGKPIKRVSDLCFATFVFSVKISYWVVHLCVVSGRIFHVTYALWSMSAALHPVSSDQQKILVIHHSLDS